MAQSPGVAPTPQPARPTPPAPPAAAPPPPAAPAAPAPVPDPSPSESRAHAVAAELRRLIDQLDTLAARLTPRLDADDLAALNNCRTELRDCVAKALADSTP